MSANTQTPISTHRIFEFVSRWDMYQCAQELC